ncbi:MAG TPA: DUF1844 domain-containing protein [Candidatus Polarisedimenticolia bacterium]|nr:DUF1844 domain-containing protein [Candidatus Polarisedimenticolia bacterium]
MSDTTMPEHDTISRADMMSALFAQLVIQQSNMAMLLLGKVPHPQTGETVRDIEAAQLFIDQLEMLETKTKGNLSKEEEQLLKQSLMSLRMAYVDAVQSPAPEKKAPEAVKAPEEGKTAEANTGTPADEESKKKFTKKY